MHLQLSNSYLLMSKIGWLIQNNTVCRYNRMCFFHKSEIRKKYEKKKLYPDSDNLVRIGIEFYAAI